MAGRRRVVHLVHQSLDGYIEGPRGEFDWPTVGPGLTAYARGLKDSADAFLYGRVVYEMMASYWQGAADGDEPGSGIGPVWRNAPKVVFARGPVRAGWNTRVAAGDLAEEIAALKEGPGEGDFLLFGGATLASALTRLGLIDEYRILVHPVVLGGGKPAFLAPDGRMELRLAESRTFDGGVLLLRYERVGHEADPRA
ncbi:dihydrofolate reductase family protein [Streptomyces sp. NPDC001941]|uniref:dihydrofolate reductase family protein n=1 Tax=Streptomyces sp. NPDC001941 TaxID=3154659 RepID=UPI0033221C07